MGWFPSLVYFTGTHPFNRWTGVVQGGLTVIEVTIVDGKWFSGFFLKVPSRELIQNKGTARKTKIRDHFSSRQFHSPMLMLQVCQTDQRGLKEGE